MKARSTASRLVTVLGCLFTTIGCSCGVRAAGGNRVKAIQFKNPKDQQAQIQKNEIKIDAKKWIRAHSNFATSGKVYKMVR